MKNYGTININRSIPTKAYVDHAASAGDGSLPIDIKAHLEWHTNNIEGNYGKLRVVIDSSAEEFAKLPSVHFVLYRYVNSRSTHHAEYDSEYMRVHGWVYNPDEYPVFTFMRTDREPFIEFEMVRIDTYYKLVGSSDKHPLQYAKITDYQAQCDMNNHNSTSFHPMVSLSKKCAIAIVSDGKRISDFMKFRVIKQRNLIGDEYYAICRW